MNKFQSENPDGDIMQKIANEMVNLELLKQAGGGHFEAKISEIKTGLEEGHDFRGLTSIETKELLMQMGIGLYQKSHEHISTDDEGSSRVSDLRDYRAALARRLECDIRNGRHGPVQN